MLNRSNLKQLFVGLNACLFVCLFISSFVCLSIYCSANYSCCELKKVSDQSLPNCFLTNFLSIQASKVISHTAIQITPNMPYKHETIYKRLQRPIEKLPESIIKHDSFQLNHQELLQYHQYDH